MNKPQAFTAELPADFDMNSVVWDRYTGKPDPDYTIDYSIAVAASDIPANKIDLLVRWAPNAYCHYHRHLGATKVAVIEGEQHIIEERGLETVHKIRKAGFRGQVPDGEVHEERAGPNGLVMLFSIHAPANGVAFEVLDENDQVIASPTVEDFVARRLGAKK